MSPLPLLVRSAMACSPFGRPSGLRSIRRNFYFIPGAAGAPPMHQRGSAIPGARLLRPQLGSLQQWAFCSLTSPRASTSAARILHQGGPDKHGHF